MKKLFSILILLLFVLCTCSCSKQQMDDSQGSQAVGTDQSSISEGFKDSMLNSEGSDQFVQSEEILDWPTIPFETYEEYLAYINVNEVPNDFLSYENLSTLGDFDSLVLLSSLYPYEYYLYGFMLDNFEFYLYVQHSEDDFSNDVVQNPIAIEPENDLRTCPHQQTAYYMCNNIRYKYLDGELYCVEWISNQITFTLCSQSYFSEYTGDNEILNNFLYKDRCAGAIAAFDAAIHKTDVTE